MKHIRPILGLVFFFVFYLWNFPIVFESNELLGRFDWDLYTFHVEFLRKSYLDFGSFPLWNPYYGAGFPVWENPSSKSGSFTHLLAIVFPSLTALKLSFVFYFVIAGGFNYHSFQLYNKSSKLITILFVCFFQFSGYFFQKFYAGHMNQVQGLFLPAFLFYFLYTIQNKSKWIPYLVILIAYILLSEGAIYTITQATFLLFFLSGWEIYHSTNPKESFFRFSKFVLLILVILSFKWIPMFLFVHHVGRYFVPDQFSLSISDLYPIFFGTSQHPLLSQSLTQMQYRYWEYGNYLGQIPLYLLPLLIVTKRKMIFIVGLLFLTIWIMFGNVDTISPVKLLEQLPIYSQERVYPRWSLSVVMLYTWCLAINIQSLTERTKHKFKIYQSIVILILLIIHTIDTRKMNTKYLDEIFVLQPPADTIHNQEIYPITISTFTDYGSDSRMLPALGANASINDIYENLTFYFSNETIDSKNYHGEFFLHPSLQSVKPTNWEPDSFTFDSLPKGQLLVINQKFHPGFKAINTENKPCSWNGYLAVPIQLNSESIKLKYSLFGSFRLYNPWEKSQNCSVLFPRFLGPNWN